MFPSVLHSGKGNTTETVKNSVVPRITWVTWGKEAILCDTVMVNAWHTFGKIHRTEQRVNYNPKVNDNKSSLTDQFNTGNTWKKDTVETVEVWRRKTENSIFSDQLTS
jgi:hypothetical protein